MLRNDAELVKPALGGEPCAFAELVNRYRDMACGLAYHYLRNFEEAQDAAQEAFVYAYRNLGRLRDPDKFAPWLRRITMSCCADILRRRGYRALSLDAPETATPVDSEVPLEQVTTRLLVREALDRLSEKTRLTVTLCYIGGYSHAEIAHFLEIPLNTVRSRLQQAKRQLRQEMRHMVTEVLNEGKPDPQFTRRVVEEAMQRGEAASKSYKKGEAARYYDEALTALERWEPSEEQRRLKMQALWKKGSVTDPIKMGQPDALALFEQALAIAEALGDRPGQADKLLGLGSAYSNAGQGEKSVESFRKARAIYAELGDAGGQGRALLSLAVLSLMSDDPAGCKSSIEEALPLFEAAPAYEGVAYCRAMLHMLAEVGLDKFPIPLWRGGCDLLEQQNGVVSFRQDTFANSFTIDDDIPAEVVGQLTVQGLFGQVGHLGKFLDAATPVGGSWSGNAWSNTLLPLQTMVTVKSRTERVTVPAGAFTDCLLTEQITTESLLPDNASPEKKEANRKDLCGVRRAWYAPGVGLVQLHVQRADGTEALLQLEDYSVQDANVAYLPLAAGNAWSYGWAHLPAEYIAKEAYRVEAQAEATWYLAHYAYAYRRDS